MTHYTETCQTYHWSSFTHGIFSGKIASSPFDHFLAKRSGLGILSYVFLTMWFQKPCFRVISIHSIGQKWQTCFLGYFPNKNSSKGYQLESWKQKRFQYDWGQNRGFWTSQVHSWGFQSLMAPSFEFFNVKTPLDGLESKNKTWWYIVVLLKNWWQSHHCLYILITIWNHIFF